jgi:hypothetical protein
MKPPSHYRGSYRLFAEARETPIPDCRTINGAIATLEACDSRLGKQLVVIGAGNLTSIAAGGRMGWPPAAERYPLGCTSRTRSLCTSGKLHS